MNVGKLHRFAPHLLVTGLMLLAQIASAADEPATSSSPPITTVAQEWANPNEMDRQSVIEHTMRPYKGESHPGVGTRTLTGKVMCEYQGWFGTPTDGGDRGWTHWGGQNGFQPGSCCIDLWPDVSELDPDERFATQFQMDDGHPIKVFSPFNRKAVLRHFK